MSGTIVGATASRFKWAVGADVASRDISGDFPILQGFDPDFQLGEIDSGPITTQPNGDPWTWDAIAALVNVGVEHDYAPTGSDRFFIGLDSQITVEVYGPSGPVLPFRKNPIGAPGFRRRGYGSVIPDPKGINPPGYSGAPYFSGAFRQAEPGNPGYIPQGVDPSNYRKIPRP